MDDLYALAEQVGQALKQNGWRLATAESCTGGGVAQAVTEIAGSSEWFAGGYVAYANDCKITMLQVPPTLIDEHGAVSEAVAAAMARGALANARVDIAVSTTGIAGPTGGVPGKPVGTVWMACATANGVKTDCQVFAGDRHAVRTQTIAHVLQMVLRSAGNGAVATQAKK